MKDNKSEKEILAAVFQRVSSWIDETHQRDAPIIEYHKPEVLAEKLKLHISNHGVGNEGLLREIDTYLKYAVRTGNPGYLNQLFGGFNFPAFLGEVITALTNTSMYTYEVAPVATLMENALMDKMLSHTGWKSGTGSLLTGGSNTNMVAMLLARNRFFPQAKQHGIQGLAKPAILVSERSHFSMLKGANTIGIGQEAVRKVPVDAQGRMRGSALELAITKARNEGFQPFMVCSTLGTTETGSFDLISEIGPIATAYGLWHHVDGSWGGSIILSEKRRSLFEGLEQADSFSWNPHKMMNIPLVCSALLVRDPNVMREEIQSHDADYIYHANDGASYDLGPASLQCGRRVDALKLWLAWKYFGDYGYAERIEHLFELAEQATSIVENDPHLELMFPTQTLNVNFRYIPPEGLDADAFNEAIRYRLVHEGYTMVNYCHLDSGLSIRLVLLNPDLNKGDINTFFDRFSEAADKVKQEFLELRNTEGL